ncbi:Cof-like hydrolase [Candidatus Rickettsiella viridis]|uniref:Cof-like hydrolase n=1 Tax=Candidatus Rickettsiella viridis TaxID=676208 RepID=A0A2Z5UW07_9COXI|nr:hypothetical protein [Candidatus Rickettsiella viridis]BBB15221.1 Cof-like hydrolase [Candidatus Rickettsiella viridis]
MDFLIKNNIYSKEAFQTIDSALNELFNSNATLLVPLDKIQILLDILVKNDVPSRLTGFIQLLSIFHQHVIFTGKHPTVAHLSYFSIVSEMLADLMSYTQTEKNQEDCAKFLSTLLDALHAGSLDLKRLTAIKKYITGNPLACDLLIIFSEKLNNNKFNYVYDLILKINNLSSVNDLEDRLDSFVTIILSNQSTLLHKPEFIGFITSLFFADGLTVNASVSEKAELCNILFEVLDLDLATPEQIKAGFYTHDSALRTIPEIKSYLREVLKWSQEAKVYLEKASLNKKDGIGQSILQCSQQDNSEQHNDKNLYFYHSLNDKKCHNVVPNLILKLGKDYFTQAAIDDKKLSESLHLAGCLSKRLNYIDAKTAKFIECYRQDESALGLSKKIKAFHEDKNEKTLFTSLEKAESKKERMLCALLLNSGLLKNRDEQDENKTAWLEEISQVYASLITAALKSIRKKELKVQTLLKELQHINENKNTFFSNPACLSSESTDLKPALLKNILANIIQNMTEFVDSDQNELSNQIIQHLKGLSDTINDSEIIKIFNALKSNKPWHDKLSDLDDNLKPLLEMSELYKKFERLKQLSTFFKNQNQAKIKKFLKSVTAQNCQHLHESILLKLAEEYCAASISDKALTYCLKLAAHFGSYLNPQNPEAVVNFLTENSNRQENKDRHDKLIAIANTLKVNWVKWFSKVSLCWEQRVLFMSLLTNDVIAGANETDLYTAAWEKYSQLAEQTIHSGECRFSDTLNLLSELSYVVAPEKETRPVKEDQTLSHDFDQCKIKWLKDLNQYGGFFSTTDPTRNAQKKKLCQTIQSIQAEQAMPYLEILKAVEALQLDILQSDQYSNRNKQKGFSRLLDLSMGIKLDVIKKIMQSNDSFQITEAFALVNKGFKESEALLSRRLANEGSSLLLNLIKSWFLKIKALFSSDLGTQVRELPKPDNYQKWPKQLNYFMEYWKRNDGFIYEERTRDYELYSISRSC